MGGPAELPPTLHSVQWPFPSKQRMGRAVDAPRGEYAALLHASQSTLKRFRIIAMEIHLLDQLDNTRFLNLSYMPLMQKLSALFDLVHVHPNNCLSPVEICGILVLP